MGGTVLLRTVAIGIRTIAIGSTTVEVGFETIATGSTTVEVEIETTAVGTTAVALEIETIAIADAIVAPRIKTIEIRSQTGQPAGGDYPERNPTRATQVTNDNDEAHEDELMPQAKTVTKTPIAILKLPARMADAITYAQAIVEAMTGNASFPTPTPTLAAIGAAISALQTAETAALSRVKGAVAVRNDKRAALVTLLKQLKAYVQTVVDANVENGGAIIQSATLAVRKTPAHKPRVFGAATGVVSGTAKLVAASAGPRSGYEWDYSLDGGKTWVQAPSTLQAKTTVTGLTPGATVQFRYRPVTKAGEGNWSQAVSLVVA